MYGYEVDVRGEINYREKVPGSMREILEHETGCYVVGTCACDLKVDY